MSEFILDKNDYCASEEARRIMSVNLAIAHRQAGRIEKSDAEIGRFQWESASNKFKICVSAVGGDVASVVALIPFVKMTNDIDLHDFRSWPAFQWVRDDASFNAALREHFDS